MDPLGILRIAMHGFGEFPRGARVTVREDCIGAHQVDIGMSSYTIDFPLTPGDVLVYSGPHLRRAEFVSVAIEAARSLLPRMADPSKRAQAKQYLELLEQGRAGPVRPVDLLIPLGVLERVASAS